MVNQLDVIKREIDQGHHTSCYTHKKDCTVGGAASKKCCDHTENGTS